MNEIHRQLLEGATNLQRESPLFTVLPAEIRNEIFAYALTDYPDPDAKYEAQTLYARPSYFAPSKSDTTLLRTCRAIYRECWHLPFLLREQTHWLAHAERAPPEYRRHYHHGLRGTLKQIAELQGEDNVQIDRLRVFAQMWSLEEGSLAALLRTPFLRPRILTLTIRHTDWWWWEDDEPLRFESRWIEQVCRDMPASVQEFRIELESLERKKGQVDKIAAMMAARWFFRRADGVVLLADASGKSHEVTRWSGSSVWQEQRWVRDEADAEARRIDYYVLTVSFRPEEVVKWRGGQVSATARQEGRDQVFKESELACHLRDERPMARTSAASIWVGNEEDGDSGSADEGGDGDEDDDEDDNDNDDDEYDENDDNFDFDSYFRFPDADIFMRVGVKRRHGEIG